MLILAGVVVSLTLGKNGLFKTAKYAVAKNSEETAREKVSVMLDEYVIYRYESNKILKDFLEEQENLEKIESIEESEEGTQTIIVDGYQVVIDEKTLEILKIEKTGPKPQISNIKITVINKNEGTEIEVKEKEYEVKTGTPLKITFDVTFEEGTLIGVNKGTLDNGKVEYTTDGTETEITFIITGEKENIKYTKRKKISVENLYREVCIADTVSIGDFINYSVGNWTQNDINKLGNMYSGTALPISQGKFGGFGIGRSKDTTITPTTDNLPNKYSGGWRVLSKNADGSIKIIHAGTPEAYFHNVGGDKATNNYPSQTILKNSRDWSMYEDSSTDSVNTNYAVKGLAHCMTYEEAYAITNSTGNTSNTLRNINAWYFVSKAYSSGNIYRWKNGGGLDYGYNSNGVRPVVILKPQVNATSIEGNITHQTPETAWKLSLE